MANLTRPEDIVRRIDEMRIRAEVERKTENVTIQLVAGWLREINQEHLAKSVEDREWYPDEWRNPDGTPRL